MTAGGCKVCRVTEKWGVTSADEELLARWRGEGCDRQGYRKLAEWLNVSLLRREMNRTGLATIGGEARSRYRRLEDESETAEEVRELLRTSGVPIDELERDFVSYGVVRKHLMECLEAERDESGGGDAAWAPDALAYTQRHAASKAADAVRALVNAGRLEAVDQPAVTVTVELTCPSCSRTVPVEEALERGRLCDCSRDAT